MQRIASNTITSKKMMEQYDNNLLEQDIENHLLKAEEDIENGRVKDANGVFKKWKEKYGL